MSIQSSANNNLQNNPLLNNLHTNKSFERTATVADSVLTLQQNLNKFSALTLEAYNDPNSAFPNMSVFSLEEQRNMGELIFGFPVAFTLWDAILYKIFQIAKQYLLVAEERDDTLRELAQIYIGGYLFSEEIPGTIIHEHEKRPILLLEDIKNFINGRIIHLPLKTSSRKAEYAKNLKKIIFLIECIKKDYKPTFSFDLSYLVIIREAFNEKASTAALFSRTELYDFCQFCLSCLRNLADYTQSCLPNTTSTTIESLIQFLERYKTHFDDELRDRYLRLKVSEEEENEKYRAAGNNNLAAIHAHLLNLCCSWLSNSLKLYLEHKLDYLLGCIFVSRNLIAWQEEKKNPLIPSQTAPRREPPIESVNKLVQACQSVNEAIGAKLSTCKLDRSPFLLNKSNVADDAKAKRERQKIVENCSQWYRTVEELKEVIATARLGYKQITELLPKTVPDVRKWLATKPEEEREKSANRISLYIFEELFQILPFLVGLEQMATYITVKDGFAPTEIPIPEQVQKTIYQYILPSLTPEMVDSIYQLIPEMLLEGLPALPTPSVISPSETIKEKTEVVSQTTTEHSPTKPNQLTEAVTLTVHSKVKNILKEIGKLPITNSRWHGSHLILTFEGNSPLVIPTNEEHLAKGTAHQIITQIHEIKSKH